MAAKDMLKFVGVGLSVLSLAALAGADVEDDPRSSDFGKIQVGKTRYDIWGGFQQYIRVATQMALGERKSVIADDIQELNGEGAFGNTRADVLTTFGRGKLAPVPSVAWDFLSGRTVQGEKTTVLNEATSHLLPLIFNDVATAIKDRGISSIFSVGIPSTFGIGTQTYLPKGYDDLDVKKDETYKFLYDNNLNISDPPQKEMSDSNYAKFITERQKEFKKEWDIVIKHGAYFNSNGNVTIDANDAEKTKPINELTHDELTQLMKSISTKVTRDTKSLLNLDTDGKPIKKSTGI